MTESATKRLSSPETRIQAVVFVIGMMLFSGLYLYRHVYARSEDLSAYSVSALSPAYDWAEHDVTVLVAVRSNCPYCEVSKNFYSTLVSFEREGKTKAHLIFVLPDEDRGVVPEQAADNQVFNAKLSSFGVTKTPTILIVNRSRKIQSAWVGQLSPDREHRLIELLRHLG
jgi:hypothetical protein